MRGIDIKLLTEGRAFSLSPKRGKGSRGENSVGGRRGLCK